MGLLRDIVNTILSGHTFAQKLNYLKYLFSKKDEVLGYKPVTISIVSTSKCTLACDMCPTHSGRVPKDYPHLQKNVRDIEFDMFKNIIDRFSSAMTVHIIGSGEPLLNRDFFRMVEYADFKKMAVKTFSNGTTIQRHTDAILNSRLSGITISINGHNAKEFSRMTGMPENTYKDIREATRHLIEKRARKGSKVGIKLSFIIDKVNYRMIPDMARFACELGADHAFFCNFLAIPYPGFRAEERALELTPEMLAEMRIIIQSLPVSIRKRCTFPTLIDRGRARFDCNAHFSQIRFDGDGNVSSCSMMLLNMTGNGNYRDKDVWNNTFFRRMRGKFLSKDRKELYEPCLWCPDNVGEYSWR